MLSLPRVLPWAWSFCPFRAALLDVIITQGVALGLELLPLQGGFTGCYHYPGCCPGLGAFALSGRLYWVLSLPRVLPWAWSFCPFRAY